MRSWLIGEKTYEGLPLLLRRPANLDLNSLRSTFPVLVVVKHTFAVCQSDGLPEPDYNDSLADMDYALTTAFDANDIGVPVLRRQFICSFILMARKDTSQLAALTSIQTPAHQLRFATPSRAGALCSSTLNHTTTVRFVRRIRTTIP